MIELRCLSGGYGGKTKVAGVNLSFPQEEITAIIGPNGCGKSTLLMMAAGLHIPYGGNVLLDGRDVYTLPRKELARTVSYLPQGRRIPNLSVRRFVMHGRFPYLGYPRRYTKEDFELADGAIKQVGLSHYADRGLGTLSGGERQKAYIAMVLAQQTEVVFLDEPTTYLDIACQLEIMALVQTLKEQGKTVVMVLHDLNLAMRHADLVAVMKEGSLLFSGVPAKACENGVLEEAFGVRVGIQDTRSFGRQYFFGG